MSNMQVKLEDDEPASQRRYSIATVIGTQGASRRMKALQSIPTALVEPMRKNDHVPGLRTGHGHSTPGSVQCQGSQCLIYTAKPKPAACSP